MKNVNFPALFLLITMSASASAEMMKMKADLSAASEVPPTKSDGKGTADITYDTASKKLSARCCAWAPRMTSSNRRSPTGRCFASSASRISSSAL